MLLQEIQYCYGTFSLSVSSISTPVNIISLLIGALIVVHIQFPEPNPVAKNIKNTYHWKLDMEIFEHKVQGSQPFTIAGTGGIDELRLYPKKSQMVSYTYSPFVGISSQCDVNNRITYFEYDGLAG